jgi:hypothetical protein
MFFRSARTSATILAMKAAVHKMDAAAMGAM